MREMSGNLPRNVFPVGDGGGTKEAVQRDNSR